MGMMTFSRKEKKEAGEKSPAEIAEIDLLISSADIEEPLLTEQPTDAPVV